MKLVVLLRGINLGSRNKVSMPTLRSVLADRGYADVQTYVQSGNVIVTTDRSAAAVERDVAAAIAAEFGLDIAVVVRTAEQIAAMVADDPFADVRDDHRFHQALFLAGEPDAAELAELEATDFAPEQLVVRPGVLHAWCPDGVQNSRLLKALGKLRVTTTARNWRTVEKLAELASQAPQRPRP